eukprot:3524136-Pleurochrysis_carterae.AAC.1
MAEDLAAVRKYIRERGFSLVYTSTFRQGVQSALFRAVRPPPRSTLNRSCGSCRHCHACWRCSRK